MLNLAEEVLLYSFALLLVFRLKGELQGVPHLLRRLARVLQQPLYPPVQAHILLHLFLFWTISGRLLLLVAVVHLLLLQEDQ